jgi:hypothetical protein
MSNLRNDVPVYCWDRKRFLLLIVIVGVIVVGIVVAQAAKNDRRHPYSSLKLCSQRTINMNSCLDTVPVKKLHFELSWQSLFGYDR